MRYVLQSSDDNGKSWENTFTKKKTKAEIEQWVQDNIYACGLDWRVGFAIKFRTSSFIYRWVWIKNNDEEVRP
jgi:hypothetical protein